MLLKQKDKKRSKELQTSSCKLSPAFKAKIALGALRGEKTFYEIASQYKLHPNQITQRKKILTEEATGLFDSRHVRKPQNEQTLIKKLYQEIGQLQVARYQRSNLRHGYRNGHQYRSLVTEFGLLDNIKIPGDR
ncbi:MAG: hypothetical protein ACFFDI_24885 [Promethearchaeota archaeon]